MGHHLGAESHSRDGVYLIAGAGATPVKVISGLKGPLGLAWVGDTLYVASIGRVDAFSHLMGTRFQSRRRILKEPAGPRLERQPRAGATTAAW